MSQRMKHFYARVRGRASCTRNLLWIRFCKLRETWMRSGESETWYQVVTTGDYYIRAETRGIEKGWSRGRIWVFRSANDWGMMLENMVMRRGGYEGGMRMIC